MTAGAYLRSSTTARSSGAVVELYDTEHPHNVFDPDGGRWVTFCATHGMLVNHPTLAIARSFTSSPEVWCGPCNGQAFEDPSFAV